MRTEHPLLWILAALFLFCMHVAGSTSGDDDKLAEFDVAGVALDAEQEQLLRAESDTFEFQVTYIHSCCHNINKYACAFSA